MLIDTVLIYSGGLDSTVLLYKLIAEGKKVACLSFNYGQRHRTELDHAEDIIDHLGIENWQEVVLPIELFEGSSQTTPDISVPHGHYAAETMKLTVVPNRNMVLLSLAVAYAVSLRATSVAYAAHSGDHAIYPDCRGDFLNALQSAVWRGNEHPVRLDAPFIDLTKSEIVRIGHELSVPFEDTWSCYEGAELHCGLCGTCVERKEAFENAGIVDPTEYKEGLPV